LFSYNYKTVNIAGNCQVCLCIAVVITAENLVIICKM